MQFLCELFDFYSELGTKLCGHIGFLSLETLLVYFLQVQLTLYFQVCEGERAMSADNHQLGHFKIEGLKLAKRGGPQVQVRSRYYIY